jgi:phage anti-repressor protein
LAATINEEDQEELASVQELYWILDLMNPSVEMYHLILELLGGQVLGLFNLETDELW